LYSESLSFEYLIFPIYELSEGEWENDDKKGEFKIKRRGEPDSKMVYK
jgi:hypothetical protein